MARALALLAPLAEQGNAVAQLKLGVIFSRGKTASPDHVAALGWFTKAAEQGQVEAQFELGRIYRDGLGTRVDGNAAVSWLERAAAKDTPHALNALGELYLGHQNVPQDFAVARSWFLRGAQVGHSPSMYNLGVLYALGHGVAQDEIEALKWLELAADTGIGEDRDKALRARSRLAERLTPVEVSWAASRVEDWSRAHLPHVRAGVGAQAMSARNMSARTYRERAYHAATGMRLFSAPADHIAQRVSTVAMMAGSVTAGKSRTRSEGEQMPTATSQK